MNLNHTHQEPYRIFSAILLVLYAFISPAANAQTPPATFTRTISTSSQSVSVDFAHHPIRSANFQVLVQQADGSFTEFTPDVARTYHGTVTGYPGATAIGLLRADNTLLARVSFEDGSTWTTTGGTASNSASAFVPAWPTSVVTSGGAGSIVYAAEVGIDSTFNHFTACGGTPAAVLEQCEFSVMSANMVYLRDAAIIHRIGKIIVRADTAQDPHTADGGDTGLLLPHIRTVWNTATPMGSTHDIAAVIHSAANGGLAYVGTIGTSSRYSANDSDGSGDFSVVWRHEVGHNWSSSHYEGGGNPEGSTIMSNNALSRFSSSEAKKIIAHRASKTSILDNLGNYSFPIPPRANQDTATFLRNASARIDVLANDADSNGQALALLSFDSVSDLGGNLTRSTGTGPGGRDEILYTPPALLSAGTDWFKYRIQDSSGMQAVGYAMLRPRSEILTPADHWTHDDASGTTTINRIRSTQNGTHENGALVNQSGANSVTRTGVYFDGSNDQTSIPAPGYNTNTLTFTAWVKRNGSQNASSPILFTRAGSSVAGFHFGSSNELRYTWDAGGYTWNSDLTVPDNTWCLVAMCVSPTGTTLHLRTPAALQSATNTATQAAEAFNGIMYLGYDSNSSTRHFKGWLDEVRVYKSTLTAPDIESLYQQAVTPPAIALAAPTSSTSISPLNVGFSASVTSFTELMDRVDFVENEASLASAQDLPWQASASVVTPGSHTVTARASFGDWGYSVDSPPVTFTTLAAPLSVVRISASLPASKRGPISGTFTFTRDHPIGAITVPFTTSGTAIAGTDYDAIPSSVTFPDGSLSQTITVNPIAATPDTTSETLVLTLNSGAAYTLGTPSTATLTIDDHITSIATGAWNAGTTWNSGAAAPVTGTQNSGEGYAVANHVVTSNDTASNSQALVARSLRIQSGGTLDLARLHASTNQNVAYNLPATSIEDGGTIQFRCSTGSSTHSIAAAVTFAGNTTLRINGGSYDNSANLTGTISGTGTIAVLSDTGAGGGTYVRQVSVTKANNPFSGNWTVTHTGGGDEYGALRANAANALGSGTVTVGTRAQLINDNATGLNSLGGVTLNGASATLKLNQPWNNTTASLSLTGGSPLVQLGNAASSIGNLSGSAGIIQGTGSSSSLTINQAAEGVYSGEMGTNLTFVKSGSAPLELAGILDPSLKLGLSQGTLSFGNLPVTAASLNQTGGTLAIDLAAPLTLSGNLTRSAGTILVNLPLSSPAIETPYVIVAYQGTRSGQPPVSFSTPVNATIDYGTGSNSAITVTFHNTVDLTVSESPAEGGATTGGGSYNQGTNATITATPAVGWQFVNWLGAGIANSASSSTTVVMDASKTVTANFTRIQHELTVTASPSQGGSATGGGTFNQGDPSPITATPTSGWQFVNWTGTGIADSNNPNTTVLIDSAKTVTANFTRIQHALTVIASPSEGGAVSGSGTFDQGSSQPVTTTPATHWRFVNWSGNGIADPNSLNTSVSIDAAKTVTANFEAIDPYVEWIDTFPSIIDPADKTATADADDDGLANAIEFVLGTDPSANTPGPVLTAGINGNNFVVTFTRVKAAGDAGFTSLIEYSAVLSETWTAATPEMTQVTDNGSTETVVVTIPASNGPIVLFARIKVEAP
jgi:hypothetical protein